MKFDGEFDAIFSNAALHWMPNAAAVAASMARALRQGGRLVAELGGKGNICEIEGAIQAVLTGYFGKALPQTRTFFPALREYAKLLEDHGLAVRSALLFDRPTPLEGDYGMERWIRQFAFYYFESLRAGEQLTALSQVIEQLRPTRWIDRVWIADYVRLRVVAVKL